MTKVLYSKEFARFGSLIYSLIAECDANSEYYTCTIIKKQGDNIWESISIPFEIMTNMLKRMLYASNLMAQHRSLITRMHIDTAEFFPDLFRVSVFTQADRSWMISGIVRRNNRSIYIGLHQTRNLMVASNILPSVYLQLEALVLLGNAVDEVKALVDSHDIQAGRVRRHIIGMKVCKETFEANLEQDLLSHISQ
jgi:hypothetical protein